MTRTLRAAAGEAGPMDEADPVRLPSSPEEDRTNILVVDDRPDKLLAFQIILEELGQNIIVAQSGEEALKRVLEHDFAVILLDVNMPGMDGFQLCDKLRNETPNKTTPVIFVTGSADFQARAQSTLRGASDIIAKPFMFIELTVKALTFSLRHRIEAQKAYIATKAATSSTTTTPGTRTDKADKSEVLM